jgi:hypothetical protein
MNFRHLIGFIFCRDFGGAQASTCAGDGCCASQQISGPMSQLGLGRAKTSAVAPHVEISPSNCISGSQIILHTRRSMPCWRIVFSTFRGCMSFHTASIRFGRPAMSVACPLSLRKLP